MRGKKNKKKNKSLKSNTRAHSHKTHTSSIYTFRIKKKKKKEFIWLWIVFWVLFYFMLLLLFLFLLFPFSSFNLLMACEAYIWNRLISHCYSVALILSLASYSYLSYKKIIHEWTRRRIYPTGVWMFLLLKFVQVTNLCFSSLLYFALYFELFTFELTRFIRFIRLIDWFILLFLKWMKSKKHNWESKKKNKLKWRINNETQ